VEVKDQYQVKISYRFAALEIWVVVWWWWWWWWWWWIGLGKVLERA